MKIIIAGYLEEDRHSSQDMFQFSAGFCGPRMSSKSKSLSMCDVRQPTEHDESAVLPPLPRRKSHAPSENCTRMSPIISEGPSLEGRTGNGVNENIDVWQVGRCWSDPIPQKYSSHVHLSEKTSAPLGFSKIKRSSSIQSKDAC